VRNNSLAMLSTIAAIAILAWWIGFFDPTTCTPDVQQAGWTSCEQIANERNLALIALIVLVVFVVSFLAIRSRRKK